MDGFTGVSILKKFHNCSNLEHSINEKEDEFNSGRQAGIVDDKIKGQTVTQLR